MKLKKLTLIVGIFFILIAGSVSSFSKENKIESKANKEVLEKFHLGEEKIGVMIKIKSEKLMQKDFTKISLGNLSFYEKEVHRNYIYKKVSLKELKELEENGDVEKISESHKIRALLQRSVSLINGSITHPLQVTGINLTGTRQIVCVIDTGINFTNSDLIGKNKSCVVDCFNKACVENCSVGDDNGHGTHVAGIVAASGGIIGTSLNASLIGVKVLNSNGDGSGDDNDLSRAIDWCVAQNVSVITMSLGTSTLYSTDCFSLMSPWTESIDNATARNISVVAATGNSGSSTGIASPACIGNVTAIGSIRKDDSTIDYNRNSLTWLLAPGVNINSTKGGSCLSGCSCSGNYMICSGTSMATPHAAGAIALIKQFLNLTGQTKTPLEIKSTLNSTGKRIYDSSSGLYYSRINVYAAILSLDNIAPNVSLVSPTNNHINLSLNQTFSCNVSDFQLANITFYLWNLTNSILNQTTFNVSGVLNSTIITIINISFGDYKWNCLASDAKGNSGFSISNFTLTIGGIRTNLISPVNQSYTNINQTNFSCDSLSSPSSSLSNVTFYIWNSSSLIYNVSKSISGSGNTTVFNYNFSYSDNYQWNCLSFNNNSNFSYGEYNYSIIYDMINPNISLLSPEDSTSYTSDSQSITFSYNISESVTNCSLIIHNAISFVNSSITNISATQSFSQTFSVGSYNWSVNCTDLAGNKGNSSQRRFTVSAPISNAVSSLSGGGGGGGAGYNTYSPTASEIIAGYTRELNKNDKIKFKFFDEKSGEHSLTVNNIGEDFIEITVESSKINLKLGIGQSARLNLTSPDYYDLYIKLDTIENNKAKITIQTIHEEISKAGISAGNRTAGETGNKTFVEKKEEKAAETPKLSENMLMKILGVFAAVFAIFIMIAILIIFIRKKNKIKKKERKIKEYKEVFDKHLKPRRAKK